MMNEPDNRSSSSSGATNEDEDTINNKNNNTTTTVPTAVTAGHLTTDDKSKRKSTMIKVSNLSKQITEGQIYELFSTCGIINRINMEMVIPPNVSHTSCVIEFFTQEDAKQCYKFWNDSRVVDQKISVHWLSANQSREFKNNKSGLLAPNSRPPLELKPIWSENDTSAEQLMKNMFKFTRRDYSLPHIDRFCLTKLPDDENIKNKNLLDAKAALNQSKSRLDVINLELWNKHAFFMNPTALVPRELKNQCNAEMCTRGWTKLFEIIKAIPEVIQDDAINDKKELNTLHLCEAPGSFICSLNHFIKTEHPDVQWSWFASTLQSDNPKNQDSWFYDMKFVNETSNHWLYGEDGTGDIINSRNIEYIWKNVKHPVTFITADGGAKISDDPYDQENIIASLKFAEITASIGALAQGGSLVIKFLTLMEPVSVSMLYLLNCVFDQVIITKPATCKETNSEVYAVCLGFKGIPKAYLAKMLQLVGPKFSVKVPFILPSDMPKEFIAEVEAQAKSFGEKQSELIDQRLSLFGNLTKPERSQVIRSRNVNSALFLKKFGVKLLRDEDRITPSKTSLVRSNEEVETDQTSAPVDEYARPMKRMRREDQDAGGSFPPSGRSYGYDYRRGTPYGDYSAYRGEVPYPPHGGAPYYPQPRGRYDPGFIEDEGPPQMYRADPYYNYPPPPHGYGRSEYDSGYYGRPPATGYDRAPQHDRHGGYRRTPPYEGESYQGRYDNRSNPHGGRNPPSYERGYGGPDSYGRPPYDNRRQRYSPDRQYDNRRSHW